MLEILTSYIIPLVWSLICGAAMWYADKKWCPQTLAGINHFYCRIVYIGVPIYLAGSAGLYFLFRSL